MSVPRSSLRNLFAINTSVDIYCDSIRFNTVEGRATGTVRNCGLSVHLIWATFSSTAAALLQEQVGGGTDDGESCQSPSEKAVV